MSGHCDSLALAGGKLSLCPCLDLSAGLWVMGQSPGCLGGQAVSLFCYGQVRTLVDGHTVRRMLVDVLITSPKKEKQETEAKHLVKQQFQLVLFKKKKMYLLIYLKG